MDKCLERVVPAETTGLAEKLFKISDAIDESREDAYDKLVAERAKAAGVSYSNADK